ncbi:pyridoxal phosphate-dependent aminotransferase [Streptomyces sp. NPDC001668]|uniref:pyridoxal phosphate-dependent aminotransferase n=1 Tax=unclassified Streptomyces TaxID=2593676 RepID=UPI0033C43565
MTMRPLVMDLGAPAHRPPAATGTGAVGYAAPGGLPELRAAFEHRVRERSGRELTATVTAGAALAFTSVVAALTAPGDRILIPDPGFPAYRSTVEALGRVAGHYPLAEAGTPALADRLAGARLLVLNSPSNPTGQVLSRQSLARIAAAARAHDVLVVADEVYADLVGDGYASMAREAPERTVVLDSVSKSFALAGARVGCAAGPAELIDRVTRTHWFLGMSVATPSQRLALAALDAGPQYLAGMREELAGKRRLCARILKTHGIEADVPEAGLFLWLDVSALGSGHAVAELLRRAARVTVSPGEPFGPSGAGHIRLSPAGDAADVAEGAERIGQTLAHLAGRTVAERVR